MYVSSPMKVENFMTRVRRLPHKGKHLIGQTDGTNILVYQAFSPQISAYALEHQHFGGPDYDFSRMSWITPGFLWTTNRSAWASKEGQEHILAITLPLIHFYTLLQEGIVSAYDETLYPTREEWKERQAESEVYLQWDPDHDPFGNEEQRRCLQVGIRRGMLHTFCTQWIRKIEDVTPLVKAEYPKVAIHDIMYLNVPYEEVIPLADPELVRRTGLNH
ncbi:MAG TPA: DUF4291 family protein [Bacteroidia bacterium]|nr:DUF4291 family protein [Bacteroidia bacterium]